VSERADNAEATSNSAAVTASELAAAEAARAALEEKRLAQVAAFRAAADAYQTQVGGKTGEPIGKILIPSIGVDVVMLEGTSTGDLRVGPGHWEETPFPGQGGNFVVSGHRTTYGAPFRKLDDLQVGDIIDLVLPYAVARYMVTRVIIVDPDEVEEVAQRGREQVSLAACHPLYSARQRIVAQGDLVSFKLTEAAAH
jgi:LPXTG-site transpeptidase (sortase) family protein